MFAGLVNHCTAGRSSKPIGRPDLETVSKFTRPGRRTLMTALIWLVTSIPAGASPIPTEIAGAKTVDAAEVVRLILEKPELIVIDARTKSDFKAGHIEGAINIKDTDISSPDVLLKVLKSRENACPILLQWHEVWPSRKSNFESSKVEL